jgi:N-acetylmuramoyl-L-alanine amidase
MKAFDPGHGGHNNGAFSPSRATREADVNLAIGLAIKRKRPLTFLTRETDETIDFDHREGRLVRVSAEFVVSGHLDSTPWAPESRGLHAYYNRGNALTEKLAQFAVDNCPHSLRGGEKICAFDNPHIREDDWKRRSQRIVRAYPQPTLLIEFGYLSNPSNLRYCHSTEGIEACADLVLSVFGQYDCLTKGLTR